MRNFHTLLHVDVPSLQTTVIYIFQNIRTINISECKIKIF